MLAGHILLVTFSVLTLSLLLAETMQFALVPLSIAPFFGLVAFTAFEIMVSFLQAYIFALLAGVYIGGATGGVGGTCGGCPGGGGGGSDSLFPICRAYYALSTSVAIVSRDAAGSRR